jgi:hypothetical protein
MRTVATGRGRPNIEHLRRVYDRAIDWYKTAESKAQLMLTVDGVLATISFGLLSGSADKLRGALAIAGPETWALFAIAILGITGSIISAVASLLSRHEHNIRSNFQELGIRVDDPDTYVPEGLWYFGHLASLQSTPVVERLSAADAQFEARALAYNVVGLSRVVLRKHRLINKGWALNSVAFIALIAAATSLLVRSQI